jgi:GNAT superfamily N-acetyltransferase
MNQPSSVTIRPARTGDWAAIRRLCCLTGDGGNPIEPERWSFFAEVWMGTYERLAPDWICVAEGSGGITGYLTGCPDTVAFERSRAFRVTLPLLARVAAGRYGWTADTRRFVRRAFGLARAAEDRFPHALLATLDARYPAHLHMNVASGFRGQGIGGALLTRYVETLRAHGVPGVHLFCGPGPLAFYTRHGFEPLGRLDLADGFRVYALARRLAGAAPR